MENKNKNYFDILNILKTIKNNNKLNKRIAFLIGNTSKSNYKKFYITPIREFNTVIIFGVIIFNVFEAKNISKYVDGKVDYIFVDSEKKIKNIFLRSKKIANIERTVKENTKISRVVTYKGNDLTVEALDLLISNLCENDIRGIGGKKITILGAGNLGSKIAIKLLERGGKIKLFRRNQQKLKTIIQMINLIKPKYTSEKIKYTKNLDTITKDSDFIIGTTDGSAVITKEMIKNANKNIIVIDVGKGTLKQDAIQFAQLQEIKIYRLDITPALCGMVESKIYFDNKFKKTIGIKTIDNENLISGGIFANKNDIIVDNINKPRKVYGISDGKGDIKKQLSQIDKTKIKKIKKILKIN
tara:strand:- start:2301 stop:3368 length:1068 start_codon:yes stop_codon:yes gene_type:complete